MAIILVNLDVSVSVLKIEFKVLPGSQYNYVAIEMTMIFFPPKN
jgi:hypothetical protein